jgi:SAM-dependent methyltransferase
MTRNRSLANRLARPSAPFRRLKAHIRVRILALQGKANRGYCTNCESNTWFVQEGPWLRDEYRCNNCRSIPRFRLLIHVLNAYFPDWEGMSIHESSPDGSSSELLRRKCRDYSASHYFEDLPRGQYRDGNRSEDLSQLTFPDHSFDLFVTQDVLEHVLEPEKAFAEIARVLKPGGAHVFTMPWYPELTDNRIRARLQDGHILHLQEPLYHGNPISEKGALVTVDWGIGFTDFVYTHSGMFTTVIQIKDPSMGLDGKFLEVFVSRKPKPKIQINPQS